MLTYPTFHQLVKLSPLLSITDQETHSQGPFKFNNEQIKLLKTLLTGKKVIVLKSRQIGSSTVLCLLDVMLAILNPKIKIGIFVHQQEAASELLGKCKSFLTQFGIYLPVENTKKLCLPNGSEIHALTAGGGQADEESKAGRAFSFGFLHISELAYWTNQSAFGGIIATNSGAPLVIESTGRGSGDLFFKLYYGNSYEKVFFSSEDHLAYQMDDTFLTEEQWNISKELGSKNRRCAAWFHHKLAESGGDLTKFLHDYPLKDEDSFKIFEGKWINKTPVTRPHSLAGGIVKTIKIYKKKEDNHKYCVGVDTSGGVGKDSNAISVLDKTSKELMAFWKDNTADVYDIKDKLIEINQLYSPDMFVIETNGVGRITYQVASKEGLPIFPFNQTEDSTYHCLLRAKQEIEKDFISGPEELTEECASLCLDKNGNFKGKKDGIMSIGLALSDIDRNPHVIPVSIDRQKVYDPNQFFESNNKDWY